jgi:hypothetical protein
VSLFGGQEVHGFFDVLGGGDQEQFVALIDDLLFRLKCRGNWLVCKQFLHGILFACGPIQRIANLGLDVRC